MRSYESASAASGTGRNFITHDSVRNQCALLNNQLTQLVDLKREAVSALDGISGLARNIDNSLRPVKEATEGLSRSLANIEKSLKRTAETFEQLEASRRLQHYIDQGLPRCTTIEMVEASVRDGNFELSDADVDDLARVQDYLSAVEKLEASLRFLDAHFGGIDSPRGTRERSRTRDSLNMALTHCEVEFSNRLMFVSQVEQCVQQETKVGDLAATMELRVDVLRHRRLTQQEEVPESPDKFVNSAKVAYLMERRKRELRILNLLAGAILAHGQGNASSEALFTSYADVRATSMGERVGRMMRSTLAEALGGPLESESEALEDLLGTKAEELQHMKWGGIQVHARVWIQYLEYTLAQVVSERSFARKIFMEERDCAAAFALVLNGNFATIASHATGIARSRKTPEKVFVLLDMLTAWEKERALAETLTSLGEHGGVAGQLASKVQEMYTMLVNSARDTYREFAMAVERDDVGGSREGKVEGTRKKVSGLIPTPTKGLRLILAGPQDGHQSQSSVPENATIHPLTAYLIQYCRRLQQYPSASRILNRRATGTTREEGEDLAGRMISRLLHTLLKNLKIKVQRLSHGKQASDGQDAQHFADVFMLNNANYILSRARCFEHAEALEQIGFFQEMRETVHRHKHYYLHASWRLSVEWLDMVSEKLGRHSALQGGKEQAESEKQLKQLLRQFQNTWKQRFRTQRAWFVPDPELRRDLRAKLTEYLLPGFARCATALDAYVTASGQSYWKRLFPLMWERELLEKQIEGQLFEGL